MRRLGRTVGQPASAVGPGQYFIDYVTDTITIGSDPNGHLVEQSYAPLGIASKWPNVTIDGLTVQKMQGNGIDIGGAGWTISNTEVRLNHVVGLSVDDGSHVSDSNIHDNGEYGMTGHGGGIVIERSTIAANDYARYATPDGACNGAGGAKLVNTVGLIVRDNDFVDNLCNGIWIDVNSLDALIENNRASRNRTDGIREEIGYNATIRGNQVFDNGRGGITVVDSPGTEVSGNSIGGNLGTELILQQHFRIDPVSAYGPHEVRDADVFGNEIWMSGRQHVGARDTDSPRQYDVFNLWNNSYHDNTYHVASPTAKHWQWGDRLISYPEWQALGHDAARALVARAVAHTAT